MPIRAFWTAVSMGDPTRASSPLKVPRRSVSTATDSTITPVAAASGGAI